MFSSLDCDNFVKTRYFFKTKLQKEAILKDWNSSVDVNALDHFSYDSEAAIHPQKGTAKNLPGIAALEPGLCSSQVCRSLGSSWPRFAGQP